MLTPDAKGHWVKAHDLIEREQAEGGKYASIRPWASKAAEQIARIAGVLAVVEGATEIDVCAVDRAAQLVDWHLDEALRLVGLSHVPAEVRDAESVLRWCRERRLAVVHSAQLLQFGPAAIRTADRLRAVMGVLERTGWAERIEDGAVIDGKRRRNAWRIHANEE